ncbi:hypothetical protein LTSEALA_4422 [Salmonella enterica subsp. enterica serovar Alachua str. R6-377]|uniref:Uncharacterized protein n=1 Tax=Salmonella enterica subsp. enterica serovar Alachua str. R6-377 TaxID=913241 RepID=G5LTG2_SALET|nr:hypothetical protein LTSEALA_4422 [Salmonella enterica subsp. enterica serovar Alachua str. R6-377]
MRGFRDDIVELAIQFFKFVAVAANLLFLLLNNTFKLLKFIKSYLRSGKTGDVAFDDLPGL